MIDFILVSLLAVVIALGAGGTFWGYRKGKKDADNANSLQDHENADDIRRRVSRNRDQRVRELDDAGWRD